ncbi:MULTISPECIES: peptidase C15 [unclassified Coleofasciculus]|uniref:pyroglutamyl-peptidase I family protein n=1 Tax=unclassified Coleofasciculus TaxID=2692782 RepID=UPI0018803865|nr:MULTISPECIES: peptidase C15 [unclassified Coleofasciculus]MBE9129484.1 peptidase C15 [Coleofasciculus sp. LEGE 07081]MBE9152080.1 peptidase C15 [Coleofasciculus sp. LEGE 07092]
MPSKILLTSFQTWLPHQVSNSSDDLIEKILDDTDSFEALSVSLIALRQLPVDVPQASRLAIAKIAELQPDAVICCGMAEKRTQLTVESGASSRYVFFPISLAIYCLSLWEIVSFNALQYGLPALFYTNERSDSNYLKTPVNLEELLVDLIQTEISHNAGQFVCEGLYYEVLNYLREHHPHIPCIFLHVPVLTPDNSLNIVADFRAIICRLASLEKFYNPHSFVQVAQ